MSPSVSLEDFDAMLFDMDGVLTATARIHAAAWKKTFDGFLERHSARLGQRQAPFDMESDYKLYVDGKLRYEGVASFLASRGIELPWGEAEDPPGDDTVCALGNRKEGEVIQALAREGVDSYQDSEALARAVRAQGLKTAVVSASKNCVPVLEAAGMADLFDTIVDGQVAEEAGLPGKPAPHTFLEAARRLGVPPERAVVVEDAISGVEAGRAGGFGLVVGVDRKGDALALEAAGAHLVLTDLRELWRPGHDHDPA